MKTVAPSNFAYLEDVLGMRPHKNPTYFCSCLKKMGEYEKRGDAWWIENSGDTVELAKRQLEEPYLLIQMTDFISGLSKVLGRHVQEKEISRKNKELISEFNKKYADYKAQNN